MIVVKLGGSLLDGDELRAWVDALAHDGAGHAVVVPGGGPFAEAVRRAQQSLHFDDGTAHRMALAAMDQFGMLLCGLADTLQPARTLQEIWEHRAARKLPVWFASALLGAGVAGIPENWDVTSDSLAAWLAGKLGARRLALVKSSPAPSADYDELARAGFVDAAFPGFARACGADVEFLAPGQQQRLRATLRETPAQCSPVSQG